MAGDGQTRRNRERGAQGIGAHGAAKFELRAGDRLVAWSSRLHLETAAEQLAVNIGARHLPVIDIEVARHVGGHGVRAGFIDVGVVQAPMDQYLVVRKVFERQEQIHRGPQRPRGLHAREHMFRDGIERR